MVTINARRYIVRNAPSNYPFSKKVFCDLDTSIKSLYRLKMLLGRQYESGNMKRMYVEDSVTGKKWF